MLGKKEPCNGGKLDLKKKTFQAVAVFQNCF